MRLGVGRCRLGNEEINVYVRDRGRATDRYKNISASRCVAAAINSPSESAAQ